MIDTTLKPAESYKRTLCEEDISDLQFKLYDISSLAVALKYILNDQDDGDEQPILSAKQLCSMIENIAREQGDQLAECL